MSEIQAWKWFAERNARDGQPILEHVVFEVPTGVVLRHEMHGQPIFIPGVKLQLAGRVGSSDVYELVHEDCDE